MRNLQVLHRPGNNFVKQLHSITYQAGTHKL
jgi:hypothetical protein